jgi:putative transposase
MVRLARTVIPGLAHHVTQRGNGRQQVFFGEADYRLYRDLLKQHCDAAGVGIWAWCLMPNHVHLVLVPGDPDGLRRALAPLHRAYAGAVHARLKRTGHFWQGRFGAVAMDEAHLEAAMRYVSLNPVRAQLVYRPENWRWSSVAAHRAGRSEGITDVEPALERYGDFGAFLGGEIDHSLFEKLRKAETIGRPIGSAAFIDDLERLSGRNLAPGRPGPKPKEKIALSPQHP